MKLQTEPLNTPQHVLKSISELPIGTGFLAFRDLDFLIRKYIVGREALDFGCGVGRSSRFLKEHGMNVVAVDISKKLLNEAIKLSKDINYILIERNCIKSIGSQFDLIFISFVLMEIPTRKEIIMIIKKLTKLLSNGGKFIIIVASDDFYTSNWLSIDTSCSKLNPSSGDVVSVYLKDYCLTINDYFWKETDCEHCFEQGSLKILKKLKPLGSHSDGKHWIDEYIKAPFVIYVLSKIL